MNKVNRRTTKPRDRGARTGMAREIAAVLLTAAGLLSGLALVTFDSLDALFVARGLPPASNLVGPLGHGVAALLLRALGFAALVLPAAFVAAGWRLFRGEARRVTIVASAAWAILLLAAATLAHLLLARRGLASFPAGGAVGGFLCRRATALLGGAGTGLSVGAVAVVALIVATDFKVAAAAGLAWRGLRSLAGLGAARARQAVDRHREAVRELRAEEAARRAAEAALVEARTPEDEDEARAVADALSEERERVAVSDDPAWARDLALFRSPAEPLVVHPEIAAAPADGDPEAPPEPPGELGEAAPEAEAAPEKPQIVLSEAMRERRRRKGRREEREGPAFAFMRSGDVFRLPTTDLLDRREPAARTELDEPGLRRAAEVIVATLREHDVEGAIRHIRPGPVVTLYEFSPAAGVKLSRIENLDKELTMALSAERIRIIAPIPGKGVVGIEVPNKDRAIVTLREVLESEQVRNAGGLLPLALGKNIEGLPVCVDLQRMPHLLIAGTTGAGKSVGLNTMILSLLYRQTPDEVRMIMVDPKMTELSVYQDVPHLLLPVVTDPQKAARTLQWAVDEMERRTQILADTASKDLRSYNAKAERLRAEGRTFGEPEAAPPRKLLVVDVAAGETEEQAEERAAREVEAPAPAPAPEFEDPSAPPPLAAEPERRLPQKLPWIVVVIDELADLMMTAPREVEISLARLAQKARATGIHLIVATQRPSTDVVTGMVKNNFPARISFRLASRHDSATIINGPGAESLLGDGDMLVLTATHPVTRVQGAFVSEGEIQRVVAFLKEQGKPVYDESILRAREGPADAARGEDEDDPAYDQALELVAQMEEVSVSKLQREMRLGYNKAAKIVERMEREGVVGPANGVKPRQVLVRPAGEMGEQPNV